MNPDKINILSIDGGGFRNLIPLIILMELEIRSARNVSCLFNMMGGTSFGAIIAASLNYPSALNSKKPKYLTRDILNKWNRQIPKIFDTVEYNKYTGYSKVLKYFRNNETNRDKNRIF